MRAHPSSLPTTHHLNHVNRFNPKGHWVHEAAALLLGEFEREYERIVSKAERHVQVGDVYDYRGMCVYTSLS